MAKPDGGAGPIYTIGHCTRSLEQLVSLLRDNSVRLLVDIRTVPKSRWAAGAAAAATRAAPCHMSTRCSTSARALLAKNAAAAAPLDPGPR